MLNFGGVLWWIGESKENDVLNRKHSAKEADLMKLFGG